MKGLIMTAPKTMGFQEITVPDVGESDILVKVKACGICTWEQKAFQKTKYPFFGGHEICGVVEKIGSAVKTNVKVGDTVSIASIIRCGECYYCRTGQDNLCLYGEDNVADGNAWGPAGFAEYVLAKGYQVYKLNNGIDYALGTVAEPVACVLRSIEKGNLDFGDVCVVQGSGIMGMLHVKLAKLRGATVIVSEPDAGRREKAVAAGADYAVSPFDVDLKEFVMEKTDNIGARAVFFTAGGVKAVEQAFDIVCLGGVIVLYGSLNPDAPISVSANKIHYSEVIVTGAAKHTRKSFKEATDLIANGTIDVSDLISERIPFEQYEFAFERAVSPETFRVVFTM